MSALWVRVRQAEDAVEGRARLGFIGEYGKGVDFVADEVDLMPVWIKVKECKNREGGKALEKEGRERKKKNKIARIPLKPRTLRRRA